MKRVSISALLCAAALCGCDASPVAPEPPRLIDSTAIDPPPDHGAIPGLDVLSRGPRRLSVHQLERTLETIAELPAGSVALDDTLALSLGEPDYLRVTEESLEPSPLFSKLMMDFAGYYCPAVLTRDATLPAEQRVILRHADVDENLRYLVLRFLALDGPAADAYVADLRQAYDAGSAGSLGDQGGWQAVCGAMLTSPELLLY